MGKWLFTIIMMAGFAAATLFVAQAGEIELTDGSVVRGEIMSVSGGVYQVKTDSLGVVSVPESKIKNIRMGASQANAGGQKAIQLFGNDQVKALEDRIVNDQDLLSSVASLGDDPAFREILKDPAIMKAIAENDVSALLSNPKILRALENQQVKAIGEKLGR